MVGAPDTAVCCLRRLLRVVHLLFLQLGDNELRPEVASRPAAALRRDVATQWFNPVTAGQNTPGNNTGKICLILSAD